MSKFFKNLFKPNNDVFSDVVWTKEDVLKWNKLTTTKEGKEILKLWYKDVHFSTMYPEGVDNVLHEEQIPVEIESILLDFSPPKIRNKKKIISIAVILIIIITIGIVYAVQYA